MKLFTPLGLIALLALLVWLLIYLIKPTYQNKMLSSTYVWKESLKYKKPDTPTSKLRNIIVIILQILIIILCSFLLATPFVANSKNNMRKQNVYIIDASANMLLLQDGETRIDKAIDKVVELSTTSIKNHEPVSIIIAGDEAKFITHNDTSIDNIKAVLDDVECTYASGDYKGAMKLANETCVDNPLSNVYYLSATTINTPGDLKLIDMKGDNDFNAGILGADAIVEENYYEFNVDTAVYGADKYVNVFITVNGVNFTSKSISAEKRINCANGKVVTTTFADLDIFAYEDATITIKMDDDSKDGYIYDDQFLLLGGKKKDINIQYCSSAPNNFIKSSLFIIQNKYADIYNVNIAVESSLSDAKSSKFDLYIYEHLFPYTMPTDGVVLFIDPPSLPVDLPGATLGLAVDGDFVVTGSDNHEILKYTDPTQITATTYRAINAPDYENLLFVDGDSIFAVNNMPASKVGILSINLNRSNLPLLIDFPVIMNNTFDYFIPTTIKRHVFDVSEKIEINARGSNVTMVDNDGNSQSIDAKSTLNISVPGKYQINETLLSGKIDTTDFYVKIPSVESNVLPINDNIEKALVIPDPKDNLIDIVTYLAGALVLLIFVERLLQIRKNI